MPQANSTTSRPRVTSPSASESTLPCSAVIAAATSSLRASSSSRKRNSTRERTDSEVRPHASAAEAALATAWSTVATSAKSTFPVTWPVAGS